MQKKKENRRCNRTRQNNNRADRKMESNDSPEIPDRGETSESPASFLVKKEKFTGQF